MVNLALILLMGQVYTALAEQLTKWGMHSAADFRSCKPAQYISMQFGLRMKINKPLRLSLSAYICIIACCYNSMISALLLLFN